MALLDATRQLQDLVIGLDGIEAAPEEPVEGNIAFPFAVTYASKGRIQFNSSGWGNYLHTIICEIHFSRSMLALAIATAMPYIESFVSALIADPTLTSTVSTINEVRYNFGALEWGRSNNIGIRFELDVKLHQT